MVRKYRSGNPFPTGAAVREIPAEPIDTLPYLQMWDGGRTLMLLLDAEDIVMGLGEQVRGINKRGWRYVSDNTDEAHHTEGKHSLYGAHNFLVIDGPQHLGLFVDTAGKVTFDIGYTMSEQLKITVEDPDYDLYLIEAESTADVVHAFRQLIGRSYIPPRWAFGFGQSRWSYMNEGEVREVVRAHRSLGIPLDMVYLDIDYMEQYEDFTVSPERFPHFREFVREMKEQHVHLVPIIDAGVKVADHDAADRTPQAASRDDAADEFSQNSAGETRGSGSETRAEDDRRIRPYAVCEEGMRRDVFCRDAEGEFFSAAVWPGKAYFPDFFREDVRMWFGDAYRSLLDQGIDGFWNDMNEPAIFYSERRLREAFEKLDAYRNVNLDAQSFFDFLGTVNGLSNAPEDYRSIWHLADTRDGGRIRVRHDKVHNLYGTLMTQAAAEGLRRYDSARRFLLFSRASYIGMHRYAGIWQGDNESFWEHLKLNVKMMPSLNMCGFLYTGADLGGFNGDTTPDLVLRWLEFGIFTPLLRDHSARGTRRQELYRIGRTEECRNILSLRYAFLPYLYSEFVKAAVRDEMLFRPLLFDYPDDARARRVEDQLLLGESIMLAPVVEQNARGRYVYLPEEMKLFRMRSASDYDEEILSAGDHYVPALEHEVLVFVRPDHLVPFAKAGGQYTDEIDMRKLDVLSFVRTHAEYALYEDDGLSTDVHLDAEHLHVFRRSCDV